jgi:glutathione synthase/RimK-type ligase-like ATP-grasp enzyme
VLDQIEAVCKPFAPLIGLAPLMRCAFLKQDLAPLGAALLARAKANPLDANAYLDCSTVLQLTGDRDIALAVQAEAINIQAHYVLQPKYATPGLRLLVLMGPGDLMSNTPIEFLLEDSDVTLLLMYVTLESEWPKIVPEHDLMMVAIAESDANQPLLRRLAKFVADWPRPVVNQPERIAALSRDCVCALLGSIDGVEMPATARADRVTLLDLAHGKSVPSLLLPSDNFPLIVRPVGSHAGQNLEKIDAVQGIVDYADRTDATHFYVSRFVDYRSADGMFRKYRIVLIEGRPFICHFAVSAHWMIHYLNAGMAESAEKRAEEAACMADFDTEFALRHATALQAIDRRMGLPYLGIDCAETRDGKLLIFEVDNAMVVHAMDADDMYPYKKPAMHKVFTAFRQMLGNKVLHK